jgi:hypothetical protein
VIGSTNAVSFQADASTVASGDYVTTTYTLTYTDEFGCSVSDDVDVLAYNVRCTNSSSGSNAPQLDKILICHGGMQLCISVNAVASHLANHTDDVLGPCGAISSCNSSKITASSNSTISGHEISTIRVYPNPTNGSFSIQLENKQEGMLQIYDLQGQVVWSERIASSNVQVVDLSNEQNGIYIVKLITQEEVITQRLVKQ